MLWMPMGFHFGGISPATTNPLLGPRDPLGPGKVHPFKIKKNTLLFLTFL